VGDAGDGSSARVVLLGPPGAGKGTQAQVLSRRLEVPAISTGEMLREAVADGSELGGKVREILAAGELVDDGTMAEVVRDRLSRPDARRGFLLDGYPRTLPQAETLAGILGAVARELDAVLLVAVPEEELVRRTLLRGRADDREEVIRERLRVYREKTAPLIGYYRERGLLREIDGNRPIDEVTAQVLGLFGVIGDRVIE
jgi:adenylate kinase